MTRSCIALLNSKKVRARPSTCAHPETIVGGGALI
jgi:hypothetical protein